MILATCSLSQTANADQHSISTNDPHTHTRTHTRTHTHTHTPVDFNSRDHQHDLIKTGFNHLRRFLWMF